MKLFTIRKDQNECVDVENKEGKLVTLESLGISVRDMNDLIVRFEDLKDSIVNGLDSSDNKALSEGEYTILAPVPVPMQDVICLGVNYKSHIEETVDVLD